MDQPYHLLDVRKKCCGTRLATDETEPDALLTDELLSDEIQRLRLFQLGAEYDLRELHQEGLRCADNVVAQAACAKRVVAKRKYRDQLTYLLTNAQLLQERLRETAQYEALASTLRQSKVSLEQLLKRLRPDDVDALMDTLRDQGTRVQEVQQLLAEPLSSSARSDEDDNQEWVDELPHAPTTAVSIARPDENGRVPMAE
jgi:glutamate/tyrosine decarboxylase-like PLP-dependent enzyme